jgi:hypothetical protein
VAARASSRALTGDGRARFFLTSTTITFSAAAFSVACPETGDAVAFRGDWSCTAVVTLVLFTAARRPAAASNSRSMRTLSSCAFSSLCFRTWSNLIDSLCAASRFLESSASRRAAAASCLDSMTSGVGGARVRGDSRRARTGDWCAARAGLFILFEKSILRQEREEEEQRRSFDEKTLLCVRPFQKKWAGRRTPKKITAEGAKNRRILKIVRLFLPPASMPLQTEDPATKKDEGETASAAFVEGEGAVVPRGTDPLVKRFDLWKKPGIVSATRGGRESRWVAVTCKDALAVCSFSRWDATGARQEGTAVTFAASAEQTERWEPALRAEELVGPLPLPATPFEPLPAQQLDQLPLRDPVFSLERYTGRLAGHGARAKFRIRLRLNGYRLASSDHLAPLVRFCWIYLRFHLPNYAEKALGVPYARLIASFEDSGDAKDLSRSSELVAPPGQEDDADSLEEDDEESDVSQIQQQTDEVDVWTRRDVSLDRSGNARPVSSREFASWVVHHIAHLRGSRPEIPSRPLLRNPNPLLEPSESDDNGQDDATPEGQGDNSQQSLSRSAAVPVVPVDAMLKPDFSLKRGHSVDLSARKGGRVASLRRRMSRVKEKSPVREGEELLAPKKEVDKQFSVLLQSLGYEPWQSEQLLLMPTSDKRAFLSRYPQVPLDGAGPESPFPGAGLPGRVDTLRAELKTIFSDDADRDERSVKCMLLLPAVEISSIPLLPFVFSALLFC